MNHLFTIIKEQIGSFYLATRLSFYEMKNANNNNFLGRGWELLNPLIQIGVYWFVFGVLFDRGYVTVGDKTFPFIFWLISGMIAWFFIHGSIMAGTRSIYSRLGMLSKMNFPLSAIPTFVIFTNFYSHAMLVGAVAVIFVIADSVSVSIHLVQLVYYLVATVIFLFSITILTATLATLVRDVVMIVQSILRMLLYVTPILWPTSSIPERFRSWMNLNPLTYLIDGYRDAFLGTGWFWDNLTQSAYFWGMVLLFLVVGSALHMRFRRYFIDYL